MQYAVTRWRRRIDINHGPILHDAPFFTLLATQARHLIEVLISHEVRKVALRSENPFLLHDNALR